MTGRSHSALAARLATAAGRAEGRLVANGTTALVVALRAAGIAGQAVAFPNGVCQQVPLAVLYAGNRPVHLDVDRATLSLSVEALEAHPGALGAVIAVHAYGVIGDIAAVAAWCRARGVWLIEDLALAQGATRHGQPAGTWGDLAVMSFGRGKIVDAGGGGAVLADDPRLIADVARHAAALPVASDADRHAADVCASRHTALYNASYGRDLDAHVAAYRAQALAAQRGWVCRSDDAWVDRAATLIDVLDANLDRRRSRAARLQRRLGVDDRHRWTCWVQPDESVYWRQQLFVPQGRDTMLRRLLAAGVPVSSWQPASDRFLAPRSMSGVQTPVCDEVGDTILNLWVNDEVDEAYEDLVTGWLIDGLGEQG